MYRKYRNPRTLALHRGQLSDPHEFYVTSVEDYLKKKGMALETSDEGASFGSFFHGTAVDGELPEHRLSGKRRLRGRNARATASTPSTSDRAVRRDLGGDRTRSS